MNVVTRGFSRAREVLSFVSRQRLEAARTLRQAVCVSAYHTHRLGQSDRPCLKRYTITQRFFTRRCLHYYFVHGEKKDLGQGCGAMAEKNNGSFSGTALRRATGWCGYAHAQPWICSICKADRGWTTDVLAKHSPQP